MKNLFIMAIIATITQFSYAQEQNKFRVGLDFGYAVPDGGGGVLIALEPKYNIGDNMNIGLRYESAALAKNITGESESLEAELAASSSLVGTFDYYFNSGNSSFAPFLGAGIGYSSLANVELGLLSEFTTDSVETIEVDGKFGGLIRAGFEVGKFRVAAAYNLIGKSDLGDGVETKNSYIGISLGFYIGGGKWRN
ncbi:MAG: hypothetical protein ABJN84_18120 [Flavobacteriaceae bacterium]